MVEVGNLAYSGLSLKAYCALVLLRKTYEVLGFASFCRISSRCGPPKDLSPSEAQGLSVKEQVFCSPLRLSNVLPLLQIVQSVLRL